MKFEIKKLEELNNIADEIVKISKTKNIILFYGKIGAGKTTLIKRICTALDVIDNVTSPTFSIINEYFTKNNNKIYHFDFYRIENEQELINIGIEEYIYSENICLIEWPQIIEDSFETENTIKVNIELNNNKRIVEINY